MNGTIVFAALAMLALGCSSSSGGGGTVTYPSEPGVPMSGPPPAADIPIMPPPGLNCMGLSGCPPFNGGGSLDASDALSDGADEGDAPGEADGSRVDAQGVGDAGTTGDAANAGAE